MKSGTEETKDTWEKLKRVSHCNNSFKLAIDFDPMVDKTPSHLS